MKHTLLILISICLCQYSYCQLDTVACSANFPYYVKDAKYIALRNIMATNNAYKDSAIVPTSHYIPILKDLNAVYQYRNLYVNSQFPYRSAIDSIYGPWNIHVQVPDSFDNSIEFEVDTSVAWARNIYNHASITGNDTIDRFVSNYGLLLSSFRLLNNYFIRIGDTNVTNMKPIKDTISSVAFTNFIGYGSVTGDGSNIYMIDSGFVRYYIFKHSYGDCPSGCIFNDRDTFAVYPGCVIGYGQLITGLTTAQQSQFTVHPNPTNGKAYIEGASNSGRIIVKLISLGGELLIETILENGKSEVDFSDQSKGLYILELNTGDGISHQKLVIY